MFMVDLFAGLEPLSEQNKKRKERQLNLKIDLETAAKTDEVKRLWGRKETTEIYRRAIQEASDKAIKKAQKKSA